MSIYITINNYNNLLQIEEVNGRVKCAVTAVVRVMLKDGAYHEVSITPCVSVWCAVCGVLF